MKHAFLIGVITIFILAVIIGAKLFIMAFSAIMYYGLIALVVASLLYLLINIRSRTKK